MRRDVDLDLPKAVVLAAVPPVVGHADADVKRDNCSHCDDDYDM